MLSYLLWHNVQSKFSLLTLYSSVTGSSNSASLSVQTYESSPFFDFTTLVLLLTKMLNIHEHNFFPKCLMCQTDYTLLPPTGLACLCQHFQSFLLCGGDREIFMNISGTDKKKKMERKKSVFKNICIHVNAASVSAFRLRMRLNKF